MASFNPHLEQKGAAALLPPRKQQVEELFALIDTDKSGSIEIKELKEMVRLVKPDLKEEDVAKQFHALDQSKDGRVQKDEFSKHYLEQFKSDDDKKFYERMQYTKKFLTRKPRLSSVFDTFDTDHSGNLNRGEIFRMVRLSKPKFTNDDLTALFNKIDTNHDHKVSRDEFILYYFNLFFNETEAEFVERVEEAFQGRRKVKLQMLFNMYDLDGNGILDLNEFALMLRMNGRKFVSADDILNTLCKIDKDHNRKVDFNEWMDYMGSIIAQMDDKHFNKAVNSMIGAAQSSKEESKKKLQAAVTTASAQATPAATHTPAVGSAAPVAAHAQAKGVQPHGHGHKH
jgi:calmodulin